MKIQHNYTLNKRVNRVYTHKKRVKLKFQIAHISNLLQRLTLAQKSKQRGIENNKSKHSLRKLTILKKYRRFQYKPRCKKLI